MKPFTWLFVEFICIFSLGEIGFGQEPKPPELAHRLPFDTRVLVQCGDAAKFMRRLTETNFYSAITNSPFKDEKRFEAIHQTMVHSGEGVVSVVEKAFEAPLDRALLGDAHFAMFEPGNWIFFSQINDAIGINEWCQVLKTSKRIGLYSVTSHHDDPDWQFVTEKLEDVEQ
jgi:hypothetical protein